MPIEQDLISITRIQGELVAAGVRCVGVDSDGNISGLNPEDASLAALVLAAKDKAIASAECQAVKAALGSGSAQWTAYQAVRNAPIDTQRMAKYALEVLAQIVQLFYSATYTNGTPKFDMTQLQAAKTRIDEIRAQFPYLP